MSIADLQLIKNDNLYRRAIIYLIHTHLLKWLYSSAFAYIIVCTSSLIWKGYQL